MNRIIVYTDGSSLDNGSADSGCGWACKLIYDGGAVMKSGGDIGKTNNQMEMTAVLQALRSITDKEASVEVYSDSKYVVETLNGNYQIKMNRSLWRKLMQEVRQFANIRFFWVKGHDKNRHNIEVDQLAVAEAGEMQRKTIGAG